MTYCRYCGMESKEPKRCEWCGKDLTVPLPSEIPEMKAAQDIVEELEERGRESRSKFFIIVGCLVAVAAGLIIWRLSLYPTVTLATLFTAGILLAAMGVIRSFEDEWLEMFIAIVLRVALPGPLALIAYIGYVIWGRIKQTIDPTAVWLLGVYFGILTTIQVVTMIVIKVASAGAAPVTVPMSVGVQFYFVDLLGLTAILVGWIASSLFSSLSS